MFKVSTGYFPIKSATCSTECIRSSTCSEPYFVTPRPIFVIPDKRWRVVDNSPNPSLHAIAGSHMYDTQCAPPDEGSSRTAAFTFAAPSTASRSYFCNASRSSMSAYPSLLIPHVLLVTPLLVPRLTLLVSQLLPLHSFPCEHHDQVGQCL